MTALGHDLMAPTPSRLVSGDPPGVLVVDDSGEVYRWRDGRYWWEAGVL